jgi:flagellar biosynthesis protein FlhG
MHDQADQLRKLVRDAVDAHGDLAPGAPIIAISGGSSGAGVTTIACGLARELAGLGKHVVLVDANLAAPRIAENFAAKAHGTLAEVLAGTRRAVEVLAPAGDGVRLLAGAEQADAALNNEAFIRLARELAALGRQSDVVLLDAGHGMNPWIDRLWHIAQQVMLVATPASTAILDAYAAVKLAQHDRLAGKLRLVLNQCDRPADAARMHASFAETCARFLACTLHAPIDLPAMQAPEDEPWRRAIRMIAADLACDFRPVAGRMPLGRVLAPHQFNPAVRFTHPTPSG